MDKEDKILEAALDTLISKCNDVKNSLASFIFKLENEGNLEAVNWPSALDSFALISSQINVVMKFLKSDNLPSLRNRILLPLLLNPELDEDLGKLTEGRVQAFNHEMVPSYLRTKNEPEVENLERIFQSKAANITLEQGQKAMNQINKIVGVLLEAIKNWREEESGESSRHSFTQTTNSNDTNVIIAAISMGKGLKGPLPGMDMKNNSQMHQPPPPSQQQSKAGKAPPAIKTNIRSTPYQRN